LQFLGTDEAEGVVEVGGHEILAAFAAVESEHGDARALAAGEISEQAAVLVVGMGDDEHEGSAGAELAEKLLECGGAVIDGEGVGKVLRGDALAGQVGGVVLRRDLGGGCERRGQEQSQGHEECGRAMEVGFHAVVGINDNPLDGRSGARTQEVGDGMRGAMAAERDGRLRRTGGLRGPSTSFGVGAKLRSG